MKTVTELVKENYGFVKLNSDRELVYESDSGFIVRVPVDDLEGSQIYTLEKGISLMKWIRRELRAQEGK